MLVNFNLWLRKVDWKVGSKTLTPIYSWPFVMGAVLFIVLRAKTQSCKIMTRSSCVVLWDLSSQSRV